LGGFGYSRIDKIVLQVSFAKEPYKRDDILQKRPITLSILLTVATPPYVKKGLYIYENRHSNKICICEKRPVKMAVYVQIEL